MTMPLAYAINVADCQEFAGIVDRPAGHGTT